MGLNIKSEETHRLVQELAARTGQSLTAAVTDAVREKLARLKEQEGEGNDLVAEILKISDECGPRWKEPFKSMDHGDLLYDERGLPK